MRVTLFWYITVSPFVEFPVVDRVTLGRAKRVGPAPKVEGLPPGSGPKEVCVAFFAVVSKPVWKEPSPRRGAECDAQDRVPPGPGKAPKRGPSKRRDP